MKTWFAAAAVAAATLAGPAAAQTRCHTDDAGRTMCRSADGGWIRGQTDANGNSVWRDSQGNTAVGRETSTGEAIYRDNAGNTVVGHIDDNGASIYRGDDGEVAIGHADPGPTRRPAPGAPIHCRTFNHGLSTCP